MVDHSDELIKTKKHLAEVVDECVFQERQRVSLERHFVQTLNSLQERETTFIHCIQHLVAYLTSLEEYVVLPCIDVVEKDDRNGGPNIRNTRENAFRSLECVRELSPNLLRKRSSGNSSEYQERDVPFSVQEARETVERFLQSKKRMEVALSVAEKLVREMKRPTSVHVPYSPLQPREAAKAVVMSSPPGLIRAHYQASEMTIAALNAELSVVKKMWSDSERASAAEIDRLKGEIDHRAKQHRCTVEECDVALNRLSVELETLIKENAELRKQ